MRAYVVTTGSYSDYGIEQIFSTRERAEEYIRFRINLWRKPSKYNPENRWADSTDEEINDNMELRIEEFQLDGEFLNPWDE